MNERNMYDAEELRKIAETQTRLRGIIERARAEIAADSEVVTREWLAEGLSCLFDGVGMAYQDAIYAAASRNEPFKRESLDFGHTCWGAAGDLAFKLETVRE